jgi:hypothetical protein
MVLNKRTRRLQYAIVTRQSLNPTVLPEILAEFDKALLVLGVESRNHGVAELIRAFALQSRSGALLAWPPEFVCQSRSNDNYIEERRGFAEEKIERSKRPAQNKKPVRD